ncbi:alpha/beta fold hydrolase [Pseudomonadota bacterium]
MSDRHYLVNGLKLHLTFAGPEEGEPVLLIHGFPDTHQVWRHQIPVLAEAGYRVIAPDLRGFGASDAPLEKGTYHRSKVVGDLLGILDVLGIEKVKLIGHDWGGAVTWAFVLAYPQRVERFVPMAVGHPQAYPRGGLAQKLKGYYVPILASPAGESLLKLGNWRVFEWLMHYPPEVDNWKKQLRRPGRLKSAISLYRDNLDLVMPKKYPRAAVPVMGIWSSRDHALARCQMVASGDYVDGPWRYEEVADAGHWLMLEKPDETNRLLLDYLSDPLNGKECDE